MVKNLPANAGDLGSIPGSRRPPGGGHGNPTLVFLPAEFHGQRSLAGYSPCGHTESAKLATKQQQNNHLQKYPTKTAVRWHDHNRTCLCNHGCRISDTAE